jgi:ribosomal protein L11
VADLRLPAAPRGPALGQQRRAHIAQDGCSPAVEEVGVEVEVEVEVEEEVEVEVEVEVEEEVDVEVEEEERRGNGNNTPAHDTTADVNLRQVASFSSGSR